MKKLSALITLLTVSTLLISYTSTLAHTATNYFPEGHHTVFFDDTLLERHRDIFVDSFITDEAHMDWLTEEYHRLFTNDWEAFDVLREVVTQNVELIVDLDLELLKSLSVLELRDLVMSILYRVEVSELGLDDFVGGLRWSVYNVNTELTVTDLVERLVYVIGLDNLTFLLPQ